MIISISSSKSSTSTSQSFVPWLCSSLAWSRSFHPLHHQ
jgi:hypothetical protein